MTVTRWFLYSLLVVLGMAFGYEAVGADYQYNAIFCGVVALIFALIVPFCVPKYTKLMVTTLTIAGTAMMLAAYVVFRVNPKELGYLAPLAFGLISHTGAIIWLKDFGKPARTRAS